MGCLLRVIKLIVGLLLALILAGVILYMARGPILRIGLEVVTREVTGFSLSVEEVTASSTWPPRLMARDLVVRNPPEFIEHRAMVANKMELEMAPSVMIQGKPQIRHLAIDFQEIVLVKNKEGTINLARFIAGKNHQFANVWLVQDFDLSIGQVIFYDFSRRPDPPPQILPSRFRHRHFHDLTSPEQLMAVIVAEAYELETGNRKREAGRK